MLALVDERGTTTRRALSDATGIQPATLNRLVAGMVERGLLRNVDHPGTGQRGRPEGRVALRPDAGAVVGLEFGREHLAGAVVDATGALRHVDESLPVPSFEAGAATMDAIADAARGIGADAGLRPGQVRSMGIALHDVVTAEGAWRTVDRPGRPVFDVKGELARRLEHPIVVEDVSRAFAEAEHRFGAGQGVADMIYVFIGSHGVGGGIFVNGSMLVSSSGICGEIGHVVVEEDGSLCQCGSNGCFETVASHRAVVARFVELVEHGVTTSLAPPVSFADICTAAGAGDKGAYLVLRELADAMGRALGATVNLVGAPTIVIGGALRLAGDAFLEHVAVSLRQRVVSGLSGQVAVRYAHLPSHAGAWGVAVKAREAAIWSGGFLDDARVAATAP